MMDIEENTTLEIETSDGNEDRIQWVEQHAHKIHQIFQQWQHPIGIDGHEYRLHLEEQFADYWDDPLLKSLIESIV